MASKNATADEAELVKQRGIIKRKLTLFQKYMHNIQTNQSLSDTQIIELKNRLSQFKSIYKDFYDIQTLIDLKMDISELTDEPDPECEHFENNYQLLVAQASQLIQQNDKAVTNSESDKDHSGGTKSFIKLPTIDLPHFSGDHHDWLEYRETFQSLINRHKTLDNIQKFHYLRSSLSGSASLVIKSIEMTGDNFEVAWKLLCERYDNKRQLIANHIHALFNINHIQKESSVRLRQLFDTVQKNLRALATLGEKTEHWDTLIIYLVSSKFDSDTLRYWEEHKNTLTDMPTLECLNKFLKNRADLLETLEEAKANNNTSKSDTQVGQNTKSFTKHHTPKVPTCSICKQHHLLFSCEKFRQMPIEQRIKEVEKSKVCSNCLHPGHDNKSCQGGACKYCNQKHNTLLHLQAPKSSSVTFTSCTQNRTVLLSTAQVNILDKQGKPHTVRALLDNGSTSSYITRHLCSKLGLPIHNIDTNVTSINNQCTNITENTNIQIQSTHNNNYSTNTLCLVINQISNSVPHTFIHRNTIQIPSCIQLADPDFNIPAPIDLLLGADIFWQVLGTGKIPLGKQQPVLQETDLGWLISGCISDTQTQNTNQNKSFFVNQISDNLNRFWELENISIPSDIPQITQQSCEETFISTTTRKDDGRFVVTIPLKQSPECLGQSYNQAKNRFLNIEKRFKSDPTYKQQYLAFMQEYLDLGHMTKNTNRNIQTPSYYIPHHGIIRNSSTTTKFRAVFDASARTSNKISLNDIQTIGPVVQDDLISILIRFRQHKYIISADIEKMYRQIEVIEKQRPLQQIVFRFNESKPLNTYTLNTVTYGTASAPYLATRCLRQVGLDCQHDKEVSEIILRDFYCDDLLSGSDKKSRLIDIAMSVNTALKSAQFPLRKWQSNDLDILHKANLSSDSLHSTINLGTKDPSKTLGIYWNPNQDTMTYSTGIENSVNDKITKRKILSIIGQIFDPLGLISPSVLEAKIIMQRMWALNLQWDDSVPHDIEVLWNKFIQSLSALKQLVIPRRVFYDSPKHIQLHIFCDASQNAYGACAYVRTQSTDSEVYVQLLTAKSRVAPLKSLTIPRLELCAALTAVRLYKKVIDSLRNSHIISDCFFWSDSMIVLSWIKLSPHKLNAFVSHRINEIQTITHHHTWRYVPTKQNPADLISRGVTASTLIHSDMWFSGPDFLRDDESSWPTPPGHISNSDLPETKPQNHKNTNQCYTQIDNNSFIYNYSNFTKLTRITAYILRFIHHCRNKTQKSNSASNNFISLTTKELNQAKLKLVKISQLNSFSKEYELLSTNNTLPVKNRLISLNPFFDQASGVIRVGGRLANSRFHNDKKFPMLLPANHHICKLIFSTYHRTLLHAGPQLLLAHIRETYWPIGGRNLARKTVQSCITCRRFQGKTVTPIMGNLPEPRMHSDFAFSNVGVDYAGPIMISNRKGRGSQLIKAYICIFVCLAVKAVHLELVTDLTKESYLASLNRFISRRGKPTHIYSDNGTNFVGASNVIAGFLAQNQSSISDSAAEQGITFHFIPPYSPHFGGLWESTVKSTKHHLRRVLGSAHLTYEEMYTVLCQIEGILNSRPLTPLSSDPSDLTALTPFHFLIGRSLSVLPHPPLTDCSPTHLPRYKRVELLRQHFWTRFYKEYISQLQIRTKWKKSSGQLTEGTLVVVKDDALPPARWVLGRVTQLHPGPDGVTRVADIQTSTGTIRRAFNRICPLICGPAECL